MKFTKMQGIGNDYIYINCFEENVKTPSKLAVVMSDRHFGVGGDGIILIMPSQIADVKMRIFNADGSEAQMCGNGIRCVAKYSHYYGLCKSNKIKIETLSGVKTADLVIVNGKVSLVRVDMGIPKLLRSDIPMLGENTNVINEPFFIDGSSVNITCISMGNPHCVVFVDNVDSVQLPITGRTIETHTVFPERTNVHFAHVVSPDKIKMRSWERGSGETLACGTGAVAVCVAGVLNKITERKVTISLPGGDLEIEWSNDNKAYMTGPAEFVFTGWWENNIP